MRAKRSYRNVLAAKGFKPLKIAHTVKGAHDLELTGQALLRHDPDCVWCGDPVSQEERSPSLYAEHRTCRDIWS